MKVYLASSWRNERYPLIVSRLRQAGHEVFDWRNPEPDYNGFHWSEIDEEWKHWTPAEFRTALDHPLADDGFARDMKGLEWADVVVLLMPCGRSAHLELGWAVGSGKITAVLLSDGEPELMYRMVNHLCVSERELLQWLRWHETYRAKKGKLSRAHAPASGTYTSPPPTSVSSASSAVEEMSV